MHDLNHLNGLQMLIYMEESNYIMLIFMDFVA